MTPYHLSITFFGDYRDEAAGFWRFDLFRHDSQAEEGTNPYVHVESGCAHTREMALIAAYWAMAKHVREESG
jgi:hypothetical protein